MNDNKTPECADLIVALRTAANGGLILTGKAAGVIVKPQCLEYAADLLEQLISLQTENAELEKRVEAKEAILRLYEPTLSLVADNKDTAIHRMRKAEAALSRVEAERDAAMKEIPHECRTCKHRSQKYGVCGMSCEVVPLTIHHAEWCHWEWRGVQGEA